MSMFLYPHSVFSANASVFIGLTLLAAVKTGRASKRPALQRVGRVAQCVAPFAKLLEEAQFCWLTEVPEDAGSIQGYAKVLADTILRRCQAECSLILDAYFPHAQKQEEMQILAQLHDHLRTSLLDLNTDKLVRVIRQFIQPLDALVQELGTGLYGSHFRLRNAELAIGVDDRRHLTLSALDDTICVYVPSVWGEPARAARGKCESQPAFSPILDVILLAFAYVHEQVSHLSPGLHSSLQNRLYLTDGWLWRLEVEAVSKWHRDFPWWQPWGGNCVRFIEDTLKKGQPLRGYNAAKAFSGWWGLRQPREDVPTEIAVHMITASDGRYGCWVRVLDRIASWLEESRDDAVTELERTLAASGGWRTLPDWFPGFSQRFM